MWHDMKYLLGAIFAMESTMEEENNIGKIPENNSSRVGHC
jgi:hypothetical protein